jgi:hypothetical protein
MLSLTWLSDYRRCETTCSSCGEAQSNLGDMGPYPRASCLLRLDFAEASRSGLSQPTWNVPAGTSSIAI